MKYKSSQNFKYVYAETILSILLALMLVIPLSNYLYYGDMYQKNDLINSIINIILSYSFSYIIFSYTSKKYSMSKNEEL